MGAVLSHTATVTQNLREPPATPSPSSVEEEEATTTATSPATPTTPAAPSPELVPVPSTLYVVDLFLVFGFIMRKDF